jgi:hypothetical protein
MALPGECVNSTVTKCGDCDTTLHIEVLRSNRYYIGFFCPKCGPYSRESGYYNTREEAQTALDNKTYYR